MEFQELQISIDNKLKQKDNNLLIVESLILRLNDQTEKTNNYWDMYQQEKE